MLIYLRGLIRFEGFHVNISQGVRFEGFHVNISQGVRLEGFHVNISRGGGELD